MFRELTILCECIEIIVEIVLHVINTISRIKEIVMKSEMLHGVTSLSVSVEIQYIHPIMQQNA